MQSIKKIKNLKGKKVILRLDLNVPIRKGKILDSFRIEKSIPTIKYLLQKGAKIILISHLGQESGKTLKSVYEFLKRDFDVVFASKIFSNQTEKMISDLKDGQIILLENLRIESGEEKNDLDFAKKLSQYGDIYVNDAFAVSHRKHASIVLLPKLLPSYAGLQIENEIKGLNLALKNKKHPALMILGGAKFETKIPLIKKYLNLVDQIFIGGALMNNFFKEAGMEVGKSLVDQKNFNLKNLTKTKKIFLPVDVLVKKGKKEIYKKNNEVLKDEFIADIGKQATEDLINLIKKSKFILMNGPMGNYESGFGVATEKILKALAESKAKVIVGGGDTVTLISDLKLESKIYFVSTGGGATLEYLIHGTLPGIKVLK